MIDINELRRLTQAATPGPWFSDARRNIWRRSPSDLYENGGSVAGDKPIAFVVAGRAGEGVTGYPVEDNAAFIAAANPAAISELLDRLEEAERERDEFKRACFAHISDNSILRAKIEVMEQQAPIATLHDDGYFTLEGSRPYESDFAGWRMKVYALPGAKGD